MSDVFVWIENFYACVYIYKEAGEFSKQGYCIGGCIEGWEGEGLVSYMEVYSKFPKSLSIKFSPACMITRA